MVRTTISLPDELHEGLRILAAMRKKPAGQIIAELLEAELARAAAPVIGEEDLDQRIGEAADEAKHGLTVDAFAAIDRVLEQRAKYVVRRPDEKS